MAALILVSSCFLNWTWYPDIREFFTGFHSAGNAYGKPGKVFIFFASIATAFFLTPRIWAKRWNILVCCLTVAYAVKTFILFSGCYRGICPEKQTGIWVMLIMSFLMLAAALLPRMKIPGGTSPG